MKILLDTHVLLQALTDDIRLSAQARQLIENAENEIYFSIISLWEVELKHLSHPDALDTTAREVFKYCSISGFRVTELKPEHIFALKDLRQIENAASRKDPFDRILVCQATCENMLLITCDLRLKTYESPHVMVV